MTRRDAAVVPARPAARTVTRNERQYGGGQAIDLDIERHVHIVADIHGVKTSETRLVTESRATADPGLRRPALSRVRL